jgi:hypothetical protein
MSQFPTTTTNADQFPTTKSAIVQSVEGMTTLTIVVIVLVIAAIIAGICGLIWYSRKMKKRKELEEATKHSFDHRDALALMMVEARRKKESGAGGDGAEKMRRIPGLWEKGLADRKKYAEALYPVLRDRTENPINDDDDDYEREEVLFRHQEQLRLQAARNNNNKFAKKKQNQDKVKGARSNSPAESVVVVMPAQAPFGGARL